MTNEQRLREFKDTLKIAKKWFKKKSSVLYEEKRKKLKIVWSENTVKTILKMRKSKHIAALNFADGYEPGGLVWHGVKTQEEDLCRSSNLYLSLDENRMNYPIEGKLLYSKDIVFFKDDELNMLKWNDWRICDIISCPAPVCMDDQEVMRRMRMIIDAAKLNGAEILILGKWGCGAFGNSWDRFKELWKEVLNERLF